MARLGSGFADVVEFSPLWVGSIDVLEEPPAVDVSSRASRLKKERRHRAHQTL